MRFLRIVDRFCIRVGWRRWAGVALAAPIGIFFIGGYPPTPPYLFEGDVVYPWLTLRGTLAVLLMGVWIISLACMLRAAWSIPAEQMGEAPVILSTLVVVVSMALCWLGVFFFRAPDHLSSIQFENRTYHLARYWGNVYDDPTYVVYMVYQCDTLGIVCHLYCTPLYDGAGFSERLKDARDVKAFFEIDPAGRLWVQVGPEKTVVKPGCTYGTGYDPLR